MPPLPAIAATTQTVVSGSLPGGERWANVLHFLRLGGQAYNPAHRDALRIALEAGYNDLSPFWPLGTTCERFTIRDLAVPGSPATVMQPGAIFGGVSAAKGLPNDCAAVATIDAATGGRRGRGRIFLPAPTVDSIAFAQVTGAQWNQAFVDAIAGMVGQFADAVSHPTFALGVFSRADLQTRQVVGGYVDSKVDTMRRRDNDLAGVIRTPIVP